MAFNIGGNIKKLRAEKGVTQEQLAQHLSVTCQSVSKWENSVTSPDLYLLPAIADYFEISIDELFQPNMQGYKNKAAAAVRPLRAPPDRAEFQPGRGGIRKAHRGKQGRRRGLPRLRHTQPVPGENTQPKG